ncbi:MAG: hypothetical protein JWN86_4179 [Planctomycetota bacterium]|nr:hypothetical protein [Planctomycetota bacterium]
MTFEECQKEVDSLRRKQGTERPLIRVDYGGSIYKGLLARTDSDSESRTPSSPFGLLVLEEPGLSRRPQTILQIASISSGAIRDPNEN